MYTNHQTRWTNIDICARVRQREMPFIFRGLVLLLSYFVHHSRTHAHTQWVTSIVPSTFNKFDNDTENDQWTYFVCNFRSLTTQTSEWMRVRKKMKKKRKKKHTQILCAKNTCWTAHSSIWRQPIFCMFYSNKQINNNQRISFVYEFKWCSSANDWIYCGK